SFSETVVNYSQRGKVSLGRVERPGSMVAVANGFGFRRDPVGTATVAGDNVLHALYADVGTEHRAKQLKFRFAKPFADGRRRADRAMILDEEKTSIPFALDFGHVAFLGPHLSQLL